MSSKLDNLERLARLRDGGILSESEFQAQKTALLNDEPNTIDAPLAPPVAPDTGEEDATSWNPFKPVGSLTEAENLSGSGVIAALALGASLLVDFVRVGFGALNGEVDADGIPFREGFLPFAAAYAVLILLIAALGHRSWKGRKVWSAGTLLSLSAFDCAASLFDFIDAHAKGFRQLDVILAGVAVFMSVQAVRGARGLSVFGAPSKLIV